MCVNKKLSIKRHYVLHNYHDHAFDQDAEASIVPDDLCSSDEEEKLGKRATNKKRRGPRGGVAIPFPDKLHAMLSRAEQDGKSHIVSWQPHGRCFLLHKHKEFVTEVMPLYFKQSKLTSFQRQLNLYGFSRLTSGPDRGAYYHELFLRGKEFLCKNMIRTRIKGTGIKAASNPATEPNFYIMPPVPLVSEEVADDRDNAKPDKVNSMQQQDLMLHVVSPDTDDAVLSAEIPLLPLSSSTPPPPSSTGAVPVTPSISPFQAMELPPKLPSELLLNRCLTPPPVHDSDEVFFEGKRFHYLDSCALENLKSAPASSLLDCDVLGLSLSLDHDNIELSLEEDQEMFMY